MFPDLYLKKKIKRSISHSSTYDLVKPHNLWAFFYTRHIPLPPQAHTLPGAAAHAGQGRAGSPSIPTAAEPRHFFLQPARRGSTGYPRPGWLSCLLLCWVQTGQREYTCTLYPQQLPSLFSHCCSYEKKIQDCSHGAKKPEPTKAIQVITQYLQP